MGGLWCARALIGTLAALAVGCRTPRTLEGAWYGSFVYDGADDCRLRLRDSGRFDLQCRGQEKWMVDGRWTQMDSVVEFAIDRLAKGDQLQARPRVPLRLRAGGSGNLLTLGYPDQVEKPFLLRRRMP